MADGACHVAGSATQVGLTQALEPMLSSRKVLVVLAATAAIGLVAFGVWSRGRDAQSKPPLDPTILVASNLRKIAGPTGVDCGIVPSKDAAVLTCVQSALNGRTPFSFIEVFQGIDDLSIDGTAADVHGTVWQLRYTSFAGSPNPVPSALVAKRCDRPLFSAESRPHFYCNGF